ncbi:MurR/RpiR family transcriptional regulator [Alteromonas sediminis]|uniref:MurR/RpiR family transcriptional regulator n=1 Tax=Alteromonas sediminis TaxID=2259342 RepID=A0A3N5Y203_9ALTE|nr:MurR/RpiR family transcriptional regulator [Alteromonas sediminis]RPJ66646.1 MurR/RpiR family transcriptional regulator [Alteromonas sediminis]
MSTFTKIRAIKNSLSASELKLANFTLSSANALRELSSQELAKVVGVSQSSVVKFAQKLGYKGYPAFKLGVIDALNGEASDNKLTGKITLSDDLNQIADKLLSSKHAVLNETKHLNDPQPISKAVEIIKSARRILICGLGGSALVGKDFSYKLQKLGLFAIEEPDGHAQLAIASTFGKGDLVFAISESGSTKEVVRVVNQAKENGSQVISLTRFGSTPISDLADVKLFSVAEEEATRLSSILARTAQEFIIDMVFIAITQSSRQGRQYLEKTRTVVGEFRDS